MRLNAQNLSIPIVLGAFGVAGYMVTHALPGTGAFRSLCLACCIVYLIARRSCPLNQDKLLKSTPLAILLGCITLWMGVRSLCLTSDSIMPLAYFVGEWGKVLLIAYLGVWMVLKAPNNEPQILFRAIFAGFFIHVLGVLVYQALSLARGGGLAYGMSIFGNYGYVSAMVDGAFAILLADIAHRTSQEGRLLPMSLAGISSCLLIVLSASVLLGAKASAVVTVFLSAIFVFVVFVSKSRHRKAILVTTLGLLVAAALLSLSAQNRWQHVSQSIDYAIDIEHNQRWLDDRVALPADIDASFYLRAAWFKVGVQGIVEHPFGMGYGSDAFGRYIKERYGADDFVSSHSGWVDFALANGLPGLGLLIAIGGALVMGSWRSYRSGFGIGGLSLAFLTIGFFLRGLLDGHFSTSRLAGFALLAGALWGLSLKRNPAVAAPT